MQARAIFILFVVIFAPLFHQISCGPVPKAELIIRGHVIIPSQPHHSPNEDFLALSKIPQWHCLRYFKHDTHLQRKCRNYRFHERPRE